MPERGAPWPDGRRFAFTVFDDPDAQTHEQAQKVYGFLGDLGLRTTKGIWVMEPRVSNSGGETCANRGHREWLTRLQEEGFELGYHNGAPGDLMREEVIASLDRFKDYFGRDPVTMANHYNQDAMYWGPARLSGVTRWLYLGLTLGNTMGKHSGHVEGSEHFWGDICRSRIRYCRNFVFEGVNGLEDCRFQPYHDPERPYVNYWYTSTEGSNCQRYLSAMREENQDLLEEQGGACIMYTHFGHGFFADGSINSEFRRLMKRLAAKKGWFVPVGTLLDYLRKENGEKTITREERSQLERKWLKEKLLKGTT